MTKIKEAKKKKKKEKIFINMEDGEGGEYYVKDVEKFLEKERRGLTPAELAKGTDRRLKEKFHKENF